MKRTIHMEGEILELYAGLCREAARCELHSLRAVKDARPELVVLFKSLALSLRRQAERFMVQIRGMVTDTDDAAAEVYQTILPASIDEYEKLARRAGQLGSKALSTGFDHSARVQRKNKSLYRQVAKDCRATAYHVCDFRGYVARDHAPESCPICTAPKKRFLKVAP